MIDITTWALARAYTNAAIASIPGGGAEVDIVDQSGTLSPEGLEKLKETKESVVVLDDMVYRLARIEGNNYKYLCTYTTGPGTIPSMKELDINIETGDYFTKQLVIEGSSVEYLEERLNNHIADTNVHISSSERNFWNNKVTVEALHIADENYNILFKKD